MMWDYFKDHFVAIRDKVKAGTMMLPSMVDRLTNAFKDIEILKDFDEFCKGKDISAFERALNNSREAV